MNQISIICPVKIVEKIKENNSVDIHVNNENYSDFSKSNLGYENLPEKNNFVGISENFLNSKFIPNKFVLFVGSNSCPYCKETIIKIDNLFNDKDKNGLNKYDLFYISSKNVSKDFVSKYKLDGIPTLIIFKDSEFITTYYKNDEDFLKNF